MNCDNWQPIQRSMPLAWPSRISTGPSLSSGYGSTRDLKQTWAVSTSSQRDLTGYWPSDRRMLDTFGEAHGYRGRMVSAAASGLFASMAGILA